METNDPTDMAVGQGPIVMSKIDNRMFEYGSHTSCKEAMNKTEEILRDEKVIQQTFNHYNVQEPYSLVITELIGIGKVTEIILAHRLSYVLPEKVGDSVFRISREYTQQFLQQRLSNRPCKFEAAPVPIKLVSELLLSKRCKIQIPKFESKVWEYHANRVTEEDLQPVW